MLKGNLDVLKEGLSKPRKIVITPHQKPDGDAIGSSLGLYNYLVVKGHDVKVVTPTDYPDFLKWMPGNETVVNFEAKRKEGEKLVSEADMFFCLDCNALNRIAPMDVIVGESLAFKIMIDHHLDPDDFPDFMLSDVKSSSTCELVHDFIGLIDEEPVINKETATCLYAGLLTDTNNFQNGATTSKAMRLGADMIDKGADMQYIQEMLYNQNHESRLRFLGSSLLNKMTIIPELEFGYITVNKEDGRRFNLQAGDTEGLVNFPLSIKGIKIAALIKDESNMVKISFRSKGDFSVNDFARNYFEGGGHKNAAGGRSKESLEKVTQKIIELLKIERVKKAH